MNRDKTEVFNEAVLAFKLGIPWVFCPFKLEWSEQDTEQFRLFLIDCSILYYPSIPPRGDTPQDQRYTMGIDDGKTITYISFNKHISRAFPSEVINSKLKPIKQEVPIRTKPKL